MRLDTNITVDFNVNKDSSIWYSATLDDGSPLPTATQVIYQLGIRYKRHSAWGSICQLAVRSGFTLPGDQSASWHLVLGSRCLVISTCKRITRLV